MQRSLLVSRSKLESSMRDSMVQQSQYKQSQEIMDDVTKIKKNLWIRSCCFFFNVFAMQFTQDAIFMVISNYFNENPDIRNVTHTKTTDDSDWYEDNLFKEMMRLYVLISNFVIVVLTPKLMQSQSK